jgi:hypothetical protein
MLSCGTSNTGSTADNQALSVLDLLLQQDNFDEEDFDVSSNPSAEGTNPIPEKVEQKDTEAKQGDELDEKSTDELRAELITDSARDLTQEQKLETLEPSFRSKIESVLSQLKMLGYQPHIFFAHRTISEQQALFANKASSVKFSFHTVYNNGVPAAEACDIVDKRWWWENGLVSQREEFWKDLEEAGKNNGLVWGGDFGADITVIDENGVVYKRGWDPAHLQLQPNSALGSAREQTKPDMSDAQYALGIR